MRPAFLALAFLAIASVVVPGAARAAAPIQIVAAESFYGDLATQIGGAAVAVTSILSNPDEDPHLFESSAATARAVDGAAIVIYNGAGYDPWMGKLLSASTRPERTVIVAADLVGAKNGDNPHLWYNPATFPAVAQKLADTLEKRDPAHAKTFEANLETFLHSLAPISAAIEAVKADGHDTIVTATEPVFGYMAAALGFKMMNYPFQLATMNGTEPSPKTVIAFQQSLSEGSVKILFYNAQVTDSTTKALLALAKAHHVKIVGITETEPRGQTIQAWFLHELALVKAALAK